MNNIAIYLWDQPFPIVLAGEGKAPADLLLSTAALGRVEGMAIKAEGANLVRPRHVSLPFHEIRRIAISSDERPNIPNPERIA